MSSDLFYILKWWSFIFLIGIIFLPFTSNIFKALFDKGYIFSKTLGIITVSYIIFILGIFKLVPFERVSIVAILLIVAVVAYLQLKKFGLGINKKDLPIIIFQEILFFSSLFFWCYIKSFQPDIHGLEKYMDYGFINSILRSNFFPPIDMWFPPFSINYYYFGHLTTAVIIKLTSIPNYIGYNLMLSSIFAFTVTSSFSIVSTIVYDLLKSKRIGFLSGILAGIISSLGGNLHTIYSLFTPYSPPENPVPFWQLKLNIGQLFHNGLISFEGGFPNSYWYPNATRFIPFTIHEFPSYSFVVSDLHGHVLDIPFVYLTLALIFVFFRSKNISIKGAIFMGYLVSVMYMTNAWDGIIYMLLFGISLMVVKSSILKVNNKKHKIHLFLKRITNKKAYFFSVIKYSLIVLISYFIFTLPFNSNFKPFVSGIGVLCAPDFLTKIGKLGPLLFEADHCQRTPFWMLAILYGFFYILSITFVIKIAKLTKPSSSIFYILSLILISTLLIATPEFIYAKDIYPAHYRANTMFKLGYQAFIMLSLVSSVAIVYIIKNSRKWIWIPIITVLLTLILIYPYFAIMSYFGELRDLKGLDGIKYLKTLHPEDYNAILWIEKNIKGQPVILEAQGDSYTDYGRISSNTGLPTPLGWTVHEWLWRGDYSFPQSRLEDIRLLYEGTIAQTMPIIKKYNIKYIYIGDLEREKYKNIDEAKFYQLGKIIYSNPTVKIFLLN